MPACTRLACIEYHARHRCEFACSLTIYFQKNASRSKTSSLRPCQGSAPKIRASQGLFSSSPSRQMTHGKSLRPLWGLCGPRVEDAPASPLTESAATPTVSFLCIFGLALSSGQFCRKRVIAKLHASSALSPWRMRSTTRKLPPGQSQTWSEGATSAKAPRVENYLRQDRMISSPSPVATAAPTLRRGLVKSARYRHFSLLLKSTVSKPRANVDRYHCVARVTCYRHTAHNQPKASRRLGQDACKAFCPHAHSRMNSDQNQKIELGRDNWRELKSRCILTLLVPTQDKISLNSIQDAAAAVSPA